MKMNNMRIRPHGLTLNAKRADASNPLLNTCVHLCGLPQITQANLQLNTDRLAPAAKILQETRVNNQTLVGSQTTLVNEADEVT